jgi:hypothetical protein
LFLKLIFFSLLITHILGSAKIQYISEKKRILNGISSENEIDAISGVRK